MDNNSRKPEETILQKKSKASAVDIIRFHRVLVERREFELGSQILRSGTSIGANIKESKNAQSKADFIHKQSIALKEADETQYWLEILNEAEVITKEEFEPLYSKVNELISMLTASINTSKGRR